MDSSALIEHVKALENRDNSSRGLYVQSVLEDIGINYTIQECRWPKIRNIVVDFSPGVSRRVLFSAHYDAVIGSPGANDNASGVSVLLELCRRLRFSNTPLRIVFFDREESWLRTPFLRLGLLGSLYYVWRNGIEDIDSVYNLEFCGSGDCLGIWPIKKRDRDLAAFRNAAIAAECLSIPVKCVHIPWTLLSSDHLSFRLRGLVNALTLTLVPVDQVPVLEKMLLSLSPWKLLIRRPVLPEPLASIHSIKDNSSNIKAESLNLMLELLVRLIKMNEAVAV